MNCRPILTLLQFFAPRLSQLQRFGILPGLSFLLWLALLTPAQAALMLRIAIQQNVSQVNIGSSTNAVVRDVKGRTLGQIKAMSGFAAQGRGGQVALDKWRGEQISIQPTGQGYVWIGDKWYRGSLVLVPQQSGLMAINYVDLEQYLYSVLGAEMNGSWPQEALKAQAVAARSYALYKRQRSDTLFDLGNDQQWQVYQGVQTEAPGTQIAVNSTVGQVLTYNGEIILAVFHSASGGHTENVEDVWSNPLPYLRAVPDFDRGSPVYEWTKTFSRAELSDLISGVGNIISLKPEKTTAYGSILKMKVVGDGGTRSVSGEDLSRVLNLKSTRFVVTPRYTSVTGKAEGQGVPVSFLIKGKGFGHAVGLSQWGAYNLAKQGYNYQQILLHYYKGAGLAKIDVK